MPKSMTLTTIAACLGLLGTLAGVPSRASGIVVVAHAESAIETLSREQVTHIFLGRMKRLPNGASVTAVEVEALRERFYKRLIGRNIAEINAYWARLQFSGRTQPPLRVSDSAAAVARVAEDPQAIAFVDAVPEDPRARVVLRLGP